MSCACFHPVPAGRKSRCGLLAPVVPPLAVLQDGSLVQSGSHRFPGTYQRDKFETQHCKDGSRSGLRPPVAVHSVPVWHHRRGSAVLPLCWH